MSLDKSLQIHAKSWKTILNSEGCSYRWLYKQRSEGRKKKKIVNNKHLSLINLYLPEQQCLECTAQAHHFSKQNLLTDLKMNPFLSGNLSFGNKLTLECVFLWVITRSLMYSAHYMNFRFLLSREVWSGRGERGTGAKKITVSVLAKKKNWKLIAIFNFQFF